MIVGCIGSLTWYDISVSKGFETPVGVLEVYGLPDVLFHVEQRGIGLHAINIGTHHIG